MGFDPRQLLERAVRMVEEGLPFVRNDLFKMPASSETKPYLVGSRCTSCRRTFFPRRAICCDCLKENTMEEIPLSRRGEIYTGVIAHTAPLGFKAPYAMAYIDLPEEVRLFSQLVNGERLKEFLIPGTDSLRPGIEVELVIEKIREDDAGNDVIGYKFRPI